MREIIRYYDGQSEKNEDKDYYLFKRVSTKDTLFLYYKKKEKTKDEIEKEELKNKIKEEEQVCRDQTIQVKKFTPL